MVITRTRFEARRICKDLPSIRILQSWPGPFDNWDVWQIRDVPTLRKDALFYMYLDCVRLRGVAGANKYLHTRGYEGVNDLERSLNLTKADWWLPEKFSLDVIASLRKSKLWKFLTQK